MSIKLLHGVRLPQKEGTADCVPKRMPVPAAVTIPMSMHIGAPAKPVVKSGDKVAASQVIAKTDDSALGVNIHAPKNGTVEEITDKFIIIAADAGKE